jgi:hypothetical protein
MKDFIVQPILTASTIDWVRFINIDQVLNYDTLRYENAYLSLIIIQPNLSFVVGKASNMTHQKNDIVPKHGGQSASRMG